MAKPNANGTDVPNLEPSESDPWVDEDPNKTNPKENRFVRFKSDVCARYNLSSKVFYVLIGLIVVTLLLVIIIISVGATWPHISHSQRYPVCRDSECLRAAAQIHESMNSSASPCTDLWEWACGGWVAKHPLPKDKSIWNQKQQLAKQEATRIRDLVATQHFHIATSSVEWKLKHLYESCLNVDNVNIDETRPLTNIISELGGWHILRDFESEDFDAKYVLKQLHVKFGVTAFFHITVEADPYAPGQNIIRISPSGLGLPDKAYYYKDQDDRIQNAYKELVRDVVRYLSLTRYEAEKFGNDVFYYEKRIAEITPNITTLQNPIKTCNRITISELKETMPSIPFHDILTAMFPEANLGETTEVVVTSAEYLTETSQIIASTDRQTMNGYLMWTLVRHYLPYLSEKYTEVLDNFKSELFGIQKPLKRWEMCANLAHQFMGLAINVMNEKVTPISNETSKVITKAYNSILNVIQKRIKKYKISVQLSNQLKRKLSNLQLQIGLPKQVKETAYIKDYYTKLKIIKTSLFESVKYGMEFNKKLEERLLTKSPPEDAVIKHLIKMPPEVSYVASSNLIVVPGSLLAYPVLESKYSRSIVYGRVGVEIAYAILSSIFPYDSFWTSDKKLLSQYHSTVNESLKSITNWKSCLYKYILNLNLALPYDIANESALLTLKRIAAISVANEALQLDLTGADHIHQPALETFEDSALFFLTYAQTQCSESSDQFQQYESMVHFKLTQRSFLHLVWAQLPEFSQSLDCTFNKKYGCTPVF